jgi:anti-sigma factor RsiW
MNEPIPHPSEIEWSEYLDRETPAERTRQLEAHLQACPACRRQLEALQGVFSALEDVQPVALERDLAEAVLSKLAGSRRATPVPSWRGWRLALAVQAAAAVALLVVSLPAWQPWLERALSIDLTWQIHLAATWETLVQQTVLLQQGWLEFADSWEQIVGSLTIPDEAALSTLALEILFAAAGAAWLVGNGLLLRRVDGHK